MKTPNRLSQFVFFLCAWLVALPVFAQTNTLPTVSITAPANNTVVSAPASFALSATAADGDGTISKVEFYNGATLLGTVTAAPYNFAWNAVAAGSYTVTAKAYDNVGGTTTSAPVTLISNTLPTVSITAPANNTIVAAPAAFTLTATAADTDGSISKVEFYSGATLLGTVTTAPYTYAWNTVVAGTYTVTAKAYDNRGGATTSAAVTLISNALPTVAITAPANGAIFPPASNVSLTASAADSDGTISKVEFYKGATLLGTVTASPYNYTWSSVPPGTYSITAKVYDNRGAVTTSAATTFKVNAVPTISITAPANNTVVSAPASFALSATAADDGTISKVEFYQGGTLIATATTLPYGAQVSGLVGGSYAFTAKAYDNQGVSTSSSVVNVIVNRPPVVAITSPVNYAVFASAAAVPLTASATDPDGTISKVEFYRGGVLIGTATLAPYGLSVSGLADGPYVFTARAYDNRGVTTDSVAINVTVGETAAAPVTFTYDGMGRLIGVKR